MKCQLCTREMKEGLSECPRCGFPVIAVTDDNEGTRAWIRKQADQYAEALLEKYSVGITVYAYTQNPGGALTFKEEREMPLAQAGSLRYRDVAWNSQEFNENKKITLNLVCRNGKKETRAQVSADRPSVPAPWKAGIKVNADLTAAVVIGNENSFATSGTFDLLA